MRGILCLVILPVAPSIYSVEIFGEIVPLIEGLRQIKVRMPRPSTSKLNFLVLLYIAHRSWNVALFNVLFNS